MSDINILFTLQDTSDTIGFFNSISPDGDININGQSDIEVPIISSTINNPISVETQSQNNTVISGFTDSRLDEVRTYSIANPFIVGVNGVLSIENDKIVYSIDNIEYTTDLQTNITTYVLYSKQNTSLLNDDFIFHKDTDMFIDKKTSKGDFFIVRSRETVFDKLLNVSDIETQEDINILLT